MNILHVIASLSEVNGGPTHALATLARAQVARGDDVTVVPARSEPGRTTLQPGVEGRLTVVAAPSTGRLIWYDGRVKRALRELARGRDIIHVHGTWRYHMLAACGAALEHGVPYVVRPAGNLGIGPRRHKGYLKAPYFELFERRLLNRAAAIHCCSEKEREELAGMNLRARVIVSPNPVETDLCDVAPDWPGLARLCPEIAADEKIILYLGRITAIKNLPALLDAFVLIAGDFPGWRLVVAGPHENVELLALLRQRAAAAGLEGRVSFPGMVRGGLKAAMLTRAAVFAQPSLHENFGLSLAEAMTFGHPCVVSDGVALADDIARHRAGVKVASTAAALAAGLRELIGDKAALTAYSRAARECARHFSPEAVAEQLDEEYRRCLAPARPAQLSVAR